MPSSSSRQKAFMEAVAHDKQFAAKAGVPQSVGKDFAKADNSTGLTKKKSKLSKLYKDHAG